VPANRSRTERWRESLRQIYERGGGLEFSISRGGPPPKAEEVDEDGCAIDASPRQASPPSDLVWRVRILELTEDEIVVENPVAMGQNIPVREGVELIGIIALGQNRWTFHTSVVGAKVVPVRHGPPFQAIKLEMPTTVQRCIRRNFIRVGTANLNLPKVECFPLLDPTSVVPAEIANRALIHDLQASSISGRENSASADAMLLPEVGPRFTGMLVNIGGGGLGLLIPRDEAMRADRSRLRRDRRNLPLPYNLDRRPFLEPTCFRGSTVRRRPTPMGPVGSPCHATQSHHGCQHHAGCFHVLSLFL
jgi:hypothetical protein